MSTLQVTNIQATGETASRAVSGVAAAWVNFDQATQTARNSTNLSSLTDDGVGGTIVAFSNSMTAKDYVCLFQGTNVNNNNADCFPDLITGSSTASQVKVQNYENATTYDFSYALVAIHGDLA